MVMMMMMMSDTRGRRRQDTLGPGKSKTGRDWKTSPMILKSRNLNEFVVCVVCSVSVQKYKLSSVKLCLHHVSDNILNNSIDTQYDDDTDTWTRSGH